MKKAVIYGRVSTSDQDYGRQLNELDEWAKKNGYDVVGRYAEKVTGVSKAGERKEFNKMLRFIEEEKIKMILVSELSRVGRLGVHTRVEIETLAEKGVNIFFFDKNQYTLDHKGKVDSHTMMLIGIVLDLAKIEVENTRNRIKSGLKNSAKNGKIQSSKFKPYGFKGDENKNIVVREEEFKVALKIFDMFDKGTTTNTITGWLNQKAIPTRYHDFNGTIIDGRKAESYSWSERTVHRVLTNRMWIGERWHKGELVHTSKPIIDVALFERVQQKLTDRANKANRGKTNPNYLKDIIKCQCGCGMFINIDRKKRNNTYTCMSRVNAKQYKGEFCGNPSVNIDKLLSTLHSILNEQYIKKMKGKPSTDFEERIEVKKIELANAERLLKKIDTKLANLYEDYNERIVEKEVYLSMKAKLEKDKEQLTGSLDEFRNAISSLLSAKNNPLRKFYTKELFLAEARNIIETVTIGRATKLDEKQIKKTKQDVGIEVIVKTRTGQLFGYTLSKYSKNVLVNGIIKPIVNDIMTLSVKDLVSSLRPKLKPTRYQGSKRQAA